MAKRKLSAEKRAELRAELKKAVGGGKKVADVLREVSAKYGITTITARWYLKSLDGKSQKKKSGRPKGRKAGRPAGTNGNASGFLKAVKARTENAKAAGKLIPRWQALVDKESALRRQANQLSRRLEAVSEKAGKLRSRISALMKT